MSNKRNKRMPLTSNAFLELRQKFARTDSPRGQNRKSEIENSLPEEDEDAIKAHVTLLLQEMRNGTPDLLLPLRKPERTLSYRERLKYDANVSVGDLSEFPVLRHRNYVKNVGFPERDAWEKLQVSLIHLMKFLKQRCKSLKLHYMKYTEDMDRALNEQQRKEIGLVFALKLIPSLFREDENMNLVGSTEVFSTVNHF
ncbi:uncharacterized protein [Penaeus vannamei]|uniref:uncharacterized protein n=1 Tax=Penaeus vannamei TaxID=6689 RepID=UPI00387F7C3E